MALWVKRGGGRLFFFNNKKEGTKKENHEISKDRSSKGKGDTSDRGTMGEAALKNRKASAKRKKKKHLKDPAIWSSL